MSAFDPTEPVEVVAESVRHTLAIHPWGNDLPYHFGEYVERMKREVAEVALEALDEACTIRTQEQLDDATLSAWGTLIVELHHPDDDCPEKPFCWVVPVVWEMVNQVGWMCHTYRREEAEPHLPARVIWHPDWAARS